MPLLDTTEAIGRGIGLIHQEAMLVRSLTVAENIVLGLDGGRFGGRLDLDGAAARVRELSERHGLAIDPSALIEHLPIGVPQRVEILKLLYRDARLMILDEPTAVLTPQEKDGLFAVLRALAAEGRSIILVTHKLHEIMDIASHVTVMRDGRSRPASRRRRPVPLYAASAGSRRSAPVHDPSAVLHLTHSGTRADRIGSSLVSGRACTWIRILPEAFASHVESAIGASRPVANVAAAD